MDTQDRRNTQGLRIGAFAAVFAVITTLASAGAYYAGRANLLPGAAVAIPEAAAAVATGPGLAAPAAALPDMAGIVERAGSAVVNISVTGTRKLADLDADTPGNERDDPFGDLFRHFRMPRPGGEAPVRGLGSGFIVSSDGVVLTNAHVVEGADEVTVKLTDKREFKAKVRGLDTATDVAVLKIDATGLPTVKIGNPAATRVGEWVLAIGSPFGFENSATAGIVSAKSRSLPDGSYVPFIQTDVAVNPGNSGGPLFNMAGEVIGITSQIYSSSGGYQGLSFAIPIDVAMNVERQLLATGKAHRGRLGVTIQEVNQSLAESFGLGKPEGALVNAVEKGSPAARAGIEPGDVILAVNGKEIGSSGELPAIVAGMAAGETAKLDIWRNRTRRQIDVSVGSFETTKTAAASFDNVAKSRLGVAVRPLAPGERRDGKGGLLVEDVSGAAARAGIEPGDVILAVNGQQVASVEQLRQLVAAGGKRVAVLVERGDARMFVAVPLG